MAVLPERRRPGLPYGELAALRWPLVRTTAFRLLLGLGLAAALVAALAIARSRDAQPNPLLPVGTTGMIVLDLSASAGLQPEYGELLRRIVAANEPTGVIVFSDHAYELVPPGTPGKDLAPMIRFFSADGVANPWESFQTGTNLAVGLELAQNVLERDRVERGTILLASDLEVFSDDGSRLTAALAELRSKGTELRILPLGAREEQKRFFAATVGADIFIELDEGATIAAGRADGAVQLAEENMPWLFVALAITLALLLAANERACGRLRLPTPARARS
ncbi:MAG TPA: vWA domain-containing protein [Gaiellaceae bacterium]|nr:vWA domain-containing protein [Gaiellaceae bacterium]